MAKVTITNPPPFMTNRRKCGWGSALTACNICGKIMVGHNRGVCSKCMRSLVGGLHAPHERVIYSNHIGYKPIPRDLKDGAKALSLASSVTAPTNRNAKRGANE